MPRNQHSRPTNTCRASGWKFAHVTGRTTEKAAVGLFRWATTDHTGFTKALCNMPPMGFFDTFKYILMQFLLSVFVAAMTGIWVFVLVAIVLPYLFFGEF